ERVEHVLHELGVDLGVHVAGIPRARVLEDREVQDLAGGEPARSRVGAARAATCSRGEQAEHAKANPTKGQFVWSQVENLPLLLFDALTQDCWSRTWPQIERRGRIISSRYPPCGAVQPEFILLGEAPIGISSRWGMVEPGGLEPPTSCMPCKRSPS